MVDSYGTGCGGITTQQDCVLSVISYLSYNIVLKCAWNATSNVCYTAGGDSCNPSCFVNGKTQYPGTCGAITNAPLCDQVYTGSSGSSTVCIYNPYTLVCVGYVCDYTCTGTFQKDASCTGLTNKYECEAHYYDDGTNYKNCKWLTSTCVQGDTCKKVCNGVSSVSNCSINNFDSYNCIRSYETRGSTTYDCIYNPTTYACTSKYPQQCTYAGASICTGSTVGLGFGTCASLFTTQATCNNGYTYDDTFRQCKWNIGSGICDNYKPCIAP